ncbi:hypothetical protein N1851_031200 [Merluccius polli]|uniref:Uncharacterized protein n=1 Tax=Merluccius polli TaxID=89951 RepID=A0AA47M464_MERPO|nr:hypothetical protein N1851_031200 [Merluccius polli]
MSNFDLDAFVAEPTLTVFESCRKADLRLIAGHYDVSIPSALGKAEYKAALLSALIKQQILSLPTSQVLPEGDVPLFGGAGDGGEAGGDADSKHGKVGLDSRGGAISRTGGTVKLGGPVVEDPDSDGSVGSESGSAPPSSPTLQARFKLRLARLRLGEAAAIRREAKEEREKDRAFQLSMKNLEAETAFRLRQLELQGSHARHTPEVVFPHLVGRHPEWMTDGHFRHCHLRWPRAQGLKKDLELCDSVFGEALAEDVWPSSGELGESTEKCAREKLVVPEFADVPLPLTRQALISAQQSDSSLASCFAAVSSDASVSGRQQSFVMEEGVLMRTWVARPGWPWPPQVGFLFGLQAFSLSRTTDFSWVKSPLTPSASPDRLSLGSIKGLPIAGLTRHTCESEDPECPHSPPYVGAWSTMCNSWPWPPQVGFLFGLQAFSLSRTTDFSWVKSPLTPSASPDRLSLGSIKGLPIAGLTRHTCESTCHRPPHPLAAFACLCGHPVAMWGTADRLGHHNIHNFNA